MGIFRVEKNRGYTVMSNYHLKDKNLSIKAKGLLSMILSLPDDWNYTTRGLAAISKEGVESIGTTLKELEMAGYLTREQRRDEKGRIKDTEYTIYERPQKKENKPDPESPDTDAPDTECPDTGNPDMDDPDTGNPAQLNTNQIKTHKSITHGTNPYQSNHGDGCEEMEPPVNAFDLNLMIGHVQVDIGYYELLDKYSREQLDEMVELIAEMRCKHSGTINIGGTVYSADAVRERFEKLNSRHIQYVFESLENNRTKIRNIKKYLLTVLFNAPVTMTNYHRAEFNHEYDEEDLFAGVE